MNFCTPISLRNINEKEEKEPQYRTVRGGGVSWREDGGRHRTVFLSVWMGVSWALWASRRVCQRDVGIRVDLSAYMYTLVSLSHLSHRKPFVFISWSVAVGL